VNTARNHLPPVRIVESSDPARLAMLREEWTELFRAGGAGNPFLTWEWQYTFWRAFAQRRPVWILEARDRGQRLVGFLALCARSSLGGSRRWCLLTNGLTGTDAVDVLVLPGFGPPVRAAMAQAIARAIPKWDHLDLEDLPCGSATVAALRGALLPRAVRAVVEPRFVCPSFALRGTFAEHLIRFSRRETYLRRRRWLERQPGYRVGVTESPADAPEAMDDFLRLHRMRWDPEGGSEGIPHGPVEDFHRDLAPLMARQGWLRLYRLFVGDRSVAAVYGFELSGRFYYYQSGMDPAWSARSPGLVLLGKTVEDAYARGLSDYDFLRGAEPHKLDWASDRRETCALRLRAPGLRSEAGAAAEEVFRIARDAARAIASERMWSALRRMRRTVATRGLGPEGAPTRPAQSGEERASAAAVEAHDSIPRQEG
jgi:CelD/BcsL family acetyltransferase involved in cellulose biosynthesis